MGLSRGGWARGKDRAGATDPRCGPRYPGPSRYGSRRGVRQPRTHSAAVRAGRADTVSRPEWPVHNTAKCSGKSGDGTQVWQLGSSRRHSQAGTEPQTCVRTSTLHPRAGGSPSRHSRSRGVRVLRTHSAPQRAAGALATFWPEGPAHTATVTLVTRAEIHRCGGRGLAAVITGKRAKSQMQKPATLRPPYPHPSQRKMVEAPGTPQMVEHCWQPLVTVDSTGTPQTGILMVCHVPPWDGGLRRRGPGLRG